MRLYVWAIKETSEGRDASSGETSDIPFNKESLPQGVVLCGIYLQGRAFV